MFMYLPEFGSVRRVTTGMMSGSMFGTDITYEEFERLYGVAEDSTVKRLPDASLEGKAVYVVESTPDDEDSAYERVVQYIEQERCVPLKSEFFEKEGEPRKVMTVDPDKLRQLKGAWVADEIKMSDMREGSHTTLIIKKIDVDIDIPQRVFSQRSLSKGH